jgi:hypothetical protein
MSNQWMRHHNSRSSKVGTLEMSLVLRPRRAAPVSAFPAFPPPDICAHHHQEPAGSKANGHCKFSSRKGGTRPNSAVLLCKGDSVPTPLFLASSLLIVLLASWRPSRKKKDMVTCSSPLRILSSGRGYASTVAR